MANHKSFWKRHEFLIVAIITLLFIYIIVVAHQKINFILGNELIISLKPQERTFYMNYGNVSEVDFDVSVDNFAYCTAACSYSFNDRSKNEVVDKGAFEIKKNRHFSKSYNVSVKRLGSGQDIYSFDVKCSSTRSFVCLTEGLETFRSSLIAVNYDLTETEKRLKGTLGQNVTKLLQLLGEVDVLHQQVNQKYFEVGFNANLNSLSKRKIGIDDEYDEVRVSIENLRSVWSVEDYFRLDRLFNESLFEVLGNIKKSIGNLDREIGNVVELHNEILSGLNKLSGNLEQLNSLVYAMEDHEALNTTNLNAKNFNKLASSITNNTFGDYSSLLEEFADIAEKHASAAEKTKGNASAFFLNAEFHLKYGNDLLCSLKQECKENISVAGVVKNAEEFHKKYPNTENLRQNCNSLKLLEQEYAAVRNESLKIISDKNISFPLDIGFLQLADSFKDNELRNINNSYHDSFERIKSENKTSPDIIKNAESVLPKNKSETVQINYSNYSNSVNISLYLLSKIKLFNETYILLGKCALLNEPRTEKIGEFDFEPVSANITYAIISKINTSLADAPPVCCIFNECKPCCRDDSCKNDPKTFPVIFLHGHSLAKSNSPEFSLDSFNKLQLKLQDDGYLNAGIVSLYSKNEPLQAGIWGLSGKPVTVKASYYYDAFRKEEKYIVIPTKSENIDTYALRLKDLIAIVKERTNKPKVNIIAHSMGGLVARRYIQIFGEEDINKLIMIATPNEGIADPVSDYCGLIGGSRECSDMQKNSLFINKVNDPLKQPAKVKLYAIVGKGCKMKLGDGDGIVLSEDAKLESAEEYAVNGACGGLFGEVLHTEMLNINKYPDTYKAIKEALKEQ